MTSMHENCIAEKWHNMKISDLPVEAREAKRLEEGERMLTYEQSRGELMAANPEILEKFPCDYPGCLAKPFDSHNLLRYV